jgi:hypothetical protein
MKEEKKAIVWNSGKGISIILFLSSSLFTELFHIPFKPFDDKLKTNFL